MLTKRVAPYEFDSLIVELRCPHARCYVEPCTPGYQCPNPTDYEVPYGTPLAYCHYTQAKAVP